MTTCSRKSCALCNPQARRYRVTYTYRTWAREPRSPFATGEIIYSDPSAAHEAALRLKTQGHLNICITPENAS